MKIPDEEMKPMGNFEEIEITKNETIEIDARERTNTKRETTETRKKKNIETDQEKEVPIGEEKEIGTKIEEGSFLRFLFSNCRFCCFK